MTTTIFHKGDTVYNQHGEEAEFVAKSMDEYIVRPILEDNDGFTYRSEIETWKQVFRTPPKLKLDAETAAAEKKLSELQTEIATLLVERLKFDNEERGRMERIKAHKELEDLDRYLAGEITHYVAKHDYSDTITIIPVGETVEEYSSSHNFGMLQLHPTRSWNKQITWTMRYRTKNDWRSEKEFTVIPCCGEEQAKAVARQIAEYIKKADEFKAHLANLQ